MINKIVSLFLCLLILLPQAYGNPLVPVEDSTGLNVETPKTFFVPQESEIKLGDTKLKIWILPKNNMVAPTAGYLIKRGDFRDIKRVIDSFNDEAARIKKEERKNCDLLLHQKDESCKSINKGLRDKITLKENEIKFLHEDNLKLSSELFWWKIGLGAAATTTISVLVYALVK